MGKNIKSLGAMAIVLVALLAVYFVTGNRKDSAEAAAEQEEAVWLLQKEPSEIQRIELKNGDEFLFERDSDGWILKNREDFRLSEGIVSSMAAALSNLQAQGTVEGGSLDSYGLAEPEATVTAGLADGSSKTIHFGKVTPDNKYYYAVAEGDETVYTVAQNTGKQFFYGYDMFLRKGLPQISLTGITEMAFNIGGNAYHFSLGLPYGVEYLAWAREEYIDHETGDRRMLNNAYAHSILFSGLNDIRLKGVVMDAGDLSQYGMDDPLMMNVWDDEGNNIHFYAGNDAGNGLRYIMLHGDDYVYTADAGHFTKMESIDLSRIFDRRLTDVIPKQARTVTIRGVGPDRVIRPNENDEDKAVYAKLFEINWDSLIEDMEVADESPIWTLEIQAEVESADVNIRQLNNNDGNYERQADGSIAYMALYEFYEYNDLFYAVSRDGQPAEIAIAKDTVDKSFSSVK